MTDTLAHPPQKFATESQAQEYWFETSEKYWSPLATVIHPEGYRLNRRLNLYLLLAGFAGVPLVLIATWLGASPIVVGIAFAALSLAAFAAVGIWYVKAARSRTRII
ncbi:MAG: hypothetical protein IKE66_12155 [Hyphomicrobium sp.]|nr:hypothetical protein [Hyphomicrobium sp.]